MPGLLSKARALGSSLLAAAAKSVGGGQLTPAPLPKVQNKQQSVPSYLTTAKPSDSTLPQRDRRLASTDLTTLRTQQGTRDVIREFAAASPDLAAALNAYLRTAITETYTAIARNVDGTFNREATDLVQQILTRFDTLGNYDDGFSGTWSIRSCSESLAKEIIIYGALSGELVLDKARLPRTIAPVSVTKVKFRPDTKISGLKPFQDLGGTEIDLDIPTFFYCALDQDLLQPYADSPFESAIQPVLFAQEFMNDIRKIVKRAIHPRLGVTINEEKFKKNIPQEIAHDPRQVRDFMTAMIGTIESQVNGLAPEDALVFFDTLGIEYVNNGNQSLDAEYTVLQGIIDAKVATGAKALPSILGHGSGSQNVASAETLLFLKNASGSVQMKLNEFYSKALTLAVRLFGLDVVVEFKYAAIDLRPETELEAFRAMKQSRVLEGLSLGFLEDDEASMMLFGRLTPAGFKPLSGTGFFTPPPAAAGNPASNNASGPGGSRTSKPSTPTQPKGPAKKADLDDQPALG